MRLFDPMINVYVTAIGPALAFYTQLGFTETFRAPTQDDPDHVELRLDGVTLAISTANAAARVHGIAASPGAPSFQLVLWTDDVDRTYAELLDAGAPSVSPPYDAGNDNRNAVVRDPDGTLVELVQKRPA